MQTDTLARARAEQGWTLRGRPRGRFHSYYDIRLLEYIADIAVRYGVDPKEFFRKFADAWEDRKSTCSVLTIECRRKAKESAIFLVTAGYRVVGQFPVSEYLLRETDPLKEFEYAMKRSRRILMNERTSSELVCLRIRDLKAGMKRVCLKAKVVEISEPKLTLTRFNDYVMLANATLQDETSTIKLTLWNDRIETVSVNDVLQIENANVIVFRGELQLKMGKNGRLTVLSKNDLMTRTDPEKT